MCCKINHNNFDYKQLSCIIIKEDGTFITKSINQVLYPRYLAIQKHRFYLLTDKRHKLCNGQIIPHSLVCNFTTLVMETGSGNRTIIFPIFQICGGRFAFLLRTISPMLALELDFTFHSLNYSSKKLFCRPRIQKMLFGLV